MSFYLKPPRGEIHLERALNLATKRLEFLSLLREEEDCFDLAETLGERGDLHESVAEDSPRDKVSHYYLRLAAAASGSWPLREFVLARETFLFSMRNERESSAAMLAELQKHLRQLLADSDALDLDLKCIHDAVSEILDEDVICSDTNATVRIPFRLVPSLVSKRLVPLEGGLAVIDSGSVRPFLASVFEHFFSASMRAIQAERWVIVQDQRLLDFVNHILITFSRLNPVLSGFSAGCGPPLLSADVQSASADFPPCFANAHQKLTRLHRLGHHARVAYTLFLKEIGQPRAEAVKFWSWHYSRAAASSSSVSCSHSWQKDCKKYTYSIGHLYGVEGARKNYSAHSCRAVKEMGENSPSAALVCPFASYEGAVLERILRASIGDDDVVETLMRTRSHSSNAACRLFLGAKKGEAVAEFAKPSQYYRIATNS